MKKEEVIKRLKWFKDYNEEEYCGGDRIKNEHGEWYYKVDEEDLEAFDEAIKALEGSSWIPVSERLPEAEYGESDSVLVCFENETQDVLYFDGSNWRYPTGETYISVNHKNDWHNKVVAWMPLPEPYKGKEKE